MGNDPCAAPVCTISVIAAVGDVDENGIPSSSYILFPMIILGFAVYDISSSKSVNSYEKSFV